MTSQRRPRTRGAAAVGIVLAIAGLLAGCTSDDSSSPEPSASSSSSDQSSPSASASASSSSPTAEQTQSPVPSKTVETQSPVPIESAGTFGRGVSVAVTKTTAVTSKGKGPGQISGEPAVAVTLRMSNQGARAVPLGTVIVNAYYSKDKMPASAVDGAPSRPFSGRLKQDQSTTGVYVFVIPPRDRGRVTLEISHSATEPTVVLTGSLR